MNKRVISSIAAVAAALLVFTGCAGGGGAAGGGGTPAHNDTLNIGTMSKPTSLDPKSSIGGTMPYYQGNRRASRTCSSLTTSPSSAT